MGRKELARLDFGAEIRKEKERKRTARRQNTTNGQF